jgi:uncharacterized membrane protein YfcA
MAETFTFLGTAITIDGTLLLVWMIVFLAGIFRGFAGFGSALLVVPALAYLYGPTQAIVIEVLIEIPVSLGLVFASIKHAERKAVLPMLAMFILFVPIGALLVSTMDATLLKIAISILVLAMLVVIAQQKRLAAFITPTGTYLAGAFAGLTQGMTAIAGPVFATAVLARGAPAQETRANIVCLAGGLILLSAASFWLVGLMTWATVAYAVLSMPALMLGVWAGALLFERLSNWNLRPVIIGFVAITALVTLAQALT